ncbi:MAG TPA: class I SAM-dependent methyltransferase [Prolixibacteraceae bacterium]|nr:class I SAM-dependent methyltransferase [Prolixibacteraceae bacterium]
MSDHFYTSIAKHYQHIFPLNPAQLRFLSNILPYNGARVLDTGCAAGDLTFALARFGFPIWGIDFDAEMIEIAKNAKSEDTIFPIFEQLDMRLVDQHYPGAFFDTIICFGNTLVHLLTDDDIRQFLRAAHQTLSPGGSLTIQLLNYRHILEKNIKTLPRIDNEQVTFERGYAFKEGSHLIDFNTILTVKASGEVIKNSVNLYAIKQDELHLLLEESGFEGMEYFGSFDSEPLKSDSLTLIVKGRKKENKDLN